MKSTLFCAAALFVVMLCVISAQAQTLFSYETGETGMPDVGNPPPYTLTIPTTTTQFGPPRIHLDPTQPWAYQIDLSFNSAANGPFVFQFDNLRAIPEPAMLSCCALAGGLAMLRRRRA